MTPIEFKNYRKALNLSTPQIGEVLGRSHQQILNWEKGKYKIPEYVEKELTKLVEQRIHILERL